MFLFLWGERVSLLCVCDRHIYTEDQDCQNENEKENKMATKTTTTKKAPRKRATSKKATKTTVVIETQQSSDVFDAGASQQRAIELAKKKWSYNYDVIKATLVATGFMTQEESKIPTELERDIKTQLLENCKEIVKKMQEKKKEGMPF